MQLQKKVVDLLLTDSNNNVIVAVEVKPVTNEAARRYGYEQLTSYLSSNGTTARYAILVDKEEITLWRVESRDPLALKELVSLPTEDCLRPYLGEADLAIARESYLQGLVGAWLRDLLYRWGEVEPIGYREFERTGFIADIKGSRVIEEAHK